MKILVVVAFPFYQPSGSSHNTYFRVKAFSELGHEVNVVTYPHGQEITEARIFRYPSKKFFKNLQPGEYKKKMLYDIFLFFGFIKKILFNKYDVVILHGTMYYWGAFVIPFFRIPFIANVHGHLYTDFIKWNLTKRKWLIYLAKRLEIFVVSRYKRVICIHDYLKEQYVNEKMNADKIHVIRSTVYNPYNFDKTTRVNNCLKLLYSGTFVKVQNIELIYNAIYIIAKKNEEIKVDIIGGTDDEVLNEKEIVRAMNLEDYITIHRRINHQNLNRYYAEADVLISPRVFGKDTPMKMYDYMNTGKCILAADRPIHHEVLNRDNAFLFEPTPENLAEAIMYLKQTPEKIKSLGKQVKKDFDEKYSFEIMKEKYIKVFANL